MLIRHVLEVLTNQAPTALARSHSLENALR